MIYAVSDRNIIYRIWTLYTLLVSHEVTRDEYHSIWDEYDDVYHLLHSYISKKNDPLSRCRLSEACRSQDHMRRSSYHHKGGERGFKNFSGSKPYIRFDYKPESKSLIRRSRSSKWSSNRFEAGIWWYISPIKLWSIYSCYQLYPLRQWSIVVVNELKIIKILTL